MKLYQVVTVDDITTEESIGAEIRRLHRTPEGAEAAKDDVDADWDEDWGEQPETTVISVADYATEADARADGYQIL